jgi:hypothetical protein
MPTAATALLASALMALALAGCAGNEKALTEAELSKCSPSLRALLQGREPRSVRPVPQSTRADGATVYPVLIRTADPEAVREAGIPLNSVQGPVATARLTLDQIRTAARLEAITRIEASGRSFPTQ